MALIRGVASNTGFMVIKTIRSKSIKVKATQAVYHNILNNQNVVTNQ